MLVEEPDTGQNLSEISYPMLDILSEDARDSQTRGPMCQEQVPINEHTASDKDPDNCTDYGDFPEIIGTQNERNITPGTEPQLCDEQLELVDVIMEVVMSSTRVQRAVVNQLC